jgi:hypothetical protein
MDPGPRRGDGIAGTRVMGPDLLEVVKDVLGTVGSPQGQQVVVGIRERAATSDSDQARIPNLGKDHRRLRIAAVTVTAPPSGATVMKVSVSSTLSMPRP